jgi:YVTN family beta-propeller protein
LRVKAADKLRIYVSNEESGEITVVDTEAGQVLENISVGKRPCGIKLAPDGKFVYVTCEGDSEVVAIDTATSKSCPTCSIGSV